MKKNKWIYIFVVTAMVVATVSCKKQLQVGNPNQPTLGGNVNSEAGAIALSLGAVYTNGFQNGDGWLGNSYFSLPYGYSELLGDGVGADAANQLISQMSIPDYIILDDGSKIPNTASSISVMRSNNTRASTGAGNNPFYYQWLNMYAMNNTLNAVLSVVDNIPFSGDATTRANTIKAWCYFWKGYAYANIGSQYYSGIINEGTIGTNNNYLIKDSIIAQSNLCFNKASSILSGITSTSDFSAVLSQLIPAFCQVGNGGVLTPSMWIHNINTMLARNILVNKLSPFINGNPNATITGASISTMTTADWNDVLTLASNGISNGDYVFTGRSTTVNGFFTATGGSVSALTTGPNSSTTFKISERLIQNFKTGDARLSNNFDTLNHYLSGFSFSTRYEIISGGNGASGVYVYGDKSVGNYEVFIAGSWEENQLMLGEANIRTGNIDAGLAYVDAVRAYQGAGIAPVANRGLTQTQAIAELTKERRVALVFRGLSFYDARRWGWTYDISKGGGTYGNTLLTSANVLNTNVTINYDFLDYWDIPADETVLNPPSSGSAPIVNPNF